MKLQIIPPELRPVTRQLYMRDLELREQVDLEVQAERRDRLNLLFHPERVAPE